MFLILVEILSESLTNHFVKIMLRAVNALNVIHPQSKVLMWKTKPLQIIALLSSSFSTLQEKQYVFALKVYSSKKFHSEYFKYSIFFFSLHFPYIFCSAKLELKE